MYNSLSSIFSPSLRTHPPSSLSQIAEICAEEFQACLIDKLLECWECVQDYGREVTGEGSRGARERGSGGSESVVGVGGGESSEGERGTGERGERGSGGRGTGGAGAGAGAVSIKHKRLSSLEEMKKEERVGKGEETHGKEHSETGEAGGGGGGAVGAGAGEGAEVGAGAGAGASSSAPSSSLSSLESKLKELFLSSLSSVFLSFDAMLLQRSSEQNIDGGSTAVVCVLMWDRVFVANVGDAEAVIGTRRGGNWKKEHDG